MALTLDGSAVARDILDSVRDDIGDLVKQPGSLPRLVVVNAGDDPGSAAYARAIRRTASTAGIPFELLKISSDSSTESFRQTLDNLNADQTVAGIMVLQPLPAHLPKLLVAELIDPAKDVDGASLHNIGRLEAGVATLVPSTPAGGIEILKHYDLPVAGKHAVVVGRSLVVGKPLASMLLALDATVTICHSRTPDLCTFTKSADIIALAAGRAGLLTADMITAGATVLDFGVNVIDGRLVGDADSAVAEVAGAITPVPGGTGVVTNAVLMRNTVAAMRTVLARR